MIKLSKDLSTRGNSPGTPVSHITQPARFDIRDTLLKYPSINHHAHVSIVESSKSMFSIT